MFECDGCGKVGTLEEIEGHILEQDMDDVALIVCWGAMEVGSPCWIDFHTKGIHPMTMIVDDIRKVVEDNG